MNDTEIRLQIIEFAIELHKTTNNLYSFSDALKIIVQFVYPPCIGGTAATTVLADVLKTL